MEGHFDAKLCNLFSNQRKSIFAPSRQQKKPFSSNFKFIPTSFFLFIKQKCLQKMCYLQYIQKCFTFSNSVSNLKKSFICAALHCILNIIRSYNIRIYIHESVCVKANKVIDWYLGHARSFTFGSHHSFHFHIILARQCSERLSVNYAYTHSYQKNVHCNNFLLVL